MASQAECRRFDPDRPLQKTLSAKAFAKLVEIELARFGENEGRTMEGRGAQTATRLPRAVPGLARVKPPFDRFLIQGYLGGPIYYRPQAFPYARPPAPRSSRREVGHG